MKEIAIYQNLPEKKQHQTGTSHGKSAMSKITLAPKDSASETFTKRQKVVLITLAVLLVLSFILAWHTTIIGLLAVITLFYCTDVVVNLYLLIKSITDHAEINFHDADMLIHAPDEWPTYTILCPLYKEFVVLPQFIKAMEALDYPKDKLQITLLLEEDDEESIAWVSSRSLPAYFNVLIVPESQPKTKPKAITYGLQYVTSEYVVVFDAEDVPESDQLKKAVVAFRREGEKTICVQAKLHFYNDDQNLLTRLFSVEYFLWFDAKLPGLHSINAPIPLGGTSNHFRTSILRSIGAWDGYNVAEDCDLGMRIAKRGYRTAIVDSVTFEEANSRPLNWFRQRTRWIKGYFQTYLVHMRHPIEFIRSSSMKDFFLFQLMVGGKTFSLLLNPLLWLITIIYFGFRPFVGEAIESFFPTPVFYLSVFCILVGNFHSLYQYMMVSGQKKQHWLIKYTMFVPLYWLAMSFAAYVALYEIFAKPFYWAKTIHGLHLQQETENVPEEEISLQPALAGANAY
jgi:cellulose synthase/poly-beta-1,6-N-acetylglucosamine synthase-like glycosyltransferase